MLKLLKLRGGFAVELLNKCCSMTGRTRQNNCVCLQRFGFKMHCIRLTLRFDTAHRRRKNHARSIFNYSVAYSAGKCAHTGNWCCEYWATTRALLHCTASRAHQARWLCQELGHLGHALNAEIIGISCIDASNKWVDKTLKYFIATTTANCLAQRIG